MLDSGNGPLIFFGGKWDYICGHYFHDNNYGAKLVCKKLGYNDGYVRKSEYKYNTGSFYLGKCRSSDSNLRKFDF